MPIELDTLLFWCGLGLLCVGLFVFLTGKKASAESKRESNRFEAFGIKIDVNNPSLILIMLGVVMMLAPKFLPQELKPAAEADSEEAETVVQDTTPPEPQPEPMVADQTQPDSLVQSPASSAPTAKAPPGESSADQRPPTPVPLPVSAPTPTPVAKIRQKPPAPPVKQTPPTPAASQSPHVAKTDRDKPVPVPHTEPPLFVVAVAADADERAGITTSAQVFAQQAAGLIVKRAGDIFDGEYRIVHKTTEDLRERLEEAPKNFAALCSQLQAEVMVLGDLRISKAWSTIDSAYWPDYHIHLHHCDTARTRQEVFKHLNPSNLDSFPFEQALQNDTMKFLSDSRWVVGD